MKREGQVRLQVPKVGICTLTLGFISSPAEATLVRGEGIACWVNRARSAHLRARVLPSPAPLLVPFTTRAPAPESQCAHQ